MKQINLKLKLYLTVATTVAALMVLALSTFFLRDRATNLAIQAQETAHQQILSTREIQVNFKKQVQEWKNVLLRGYQPDDYDTYLYRFFLEEANTRYKTTDLLNATPPDSEIHRKTRLFLDAHQELGVLYRHALAEYSPGKDGEYKVTDAKVRSIDRAPTAMLDDVVASVLHAYEVETDKIRADLKTSQYWLLALSFIALTLSVWQMLNLANKLVYELTTDMLTGLKNRRELLRKIRKHINQQRSVHLLLIDIDQFKILNEVCGHSGADQYLSNVADLLKATTREHDQLFRSNADEFVVVSHTTSAQQAVEFGHRIRNAIARMPFRWNDSTFSLSASIAVVTLNNQYKSVENVFNDLDIGLQQAKESGRNRVVLYEDDFDLMQRAKQQMRAVHTINRAIENDHFVLYKQKIKALDHTHQDHYEILIRMRGDDGSLIPPGQFLPAAEKYNVADRIDRWVIEHTCNYLNHHIQDVARYSINLSGASLSDPSFRQFITDQFGHCVFDVSRLSFEITETDAVKSINTATGILTHLKQFGCSILLDDFGSGVSSFSYLMQLPIDVIKIDGAFVRNIESNLVSKSIVRSVIDIATTLQSQTVAEFVENEQILQEVSALGVNYVQGYGIHKPEPLL